MKEIWKDVIGFENLYQISNFGNVKSFNKTKKGKILKPNKNSNGYLRVTLKSKKQQHRVFIHRLVAEHFLEKQIDKNIVNHLDCNILNNRFDNLEWTTFKGNYEHMQKMSRNKRTDIWIERLRISEREIFGKKVVGISLKDNNKIYYSSLNQVKYDGFQPSCVSECCNGKRKTHKNYIWKFL